MIALLQFRHSPYNEKVRWALDLKRVPHVRRSVLPGPHLLAVRRLTGRTSTPVLSADGRSFDQSADIVAWLEDRFPTPALLPADPAERAEALSLQRWCDEDLTPRIRRVVLDTLLREPGEFARVFGEALPAWKQRAYALLVPVIAPVVRRGNGIRGPVSLDEGHQAITEALDFAAAPRPGGDHLVGQALSIADITLAATLAALLGPAGTPMAFAEPVSPRYRALVDRYAGHPGAAWVQRVYAQSRGAGADFEGPSA
jgi:glutathione S-transferase